MKPTTQIGNEGPISSALGSPGTDMYSNQNEVVWNSGWG